MKKRKRKKLPSLRSLKAKAWKLFSVWVRSHDANFQDKTACYTCYRLFPWTLLQAGHYKHSSYDFDPRNVKPQCAYCNNYAHGKPDDFYVHLVQEYGQEIAEELRTRKHWNDYKRQELLDIIEEYK